MKQKISNPILKQIMKQVRTFQKYPDLYNFHTKNRRENEDALVKDIQEIIKSFEIVRRTK